MSDSRPRLLYIAPDVVLDLPRALSEYFTGDYVATWNKSDAPDAAEDRRRIDASFGDFTFHPRPRPSSTGLIAKAEELWFYAKTGVRLAREHGRYDLIVCYSPFRTAIAGLCIRLFTGSPVIVEFPLNPSSVYSRARGVGGRMRHWLAPIVARLVARLSDGVMILFPWQLDLLGVSKRVPRYLVHAFVRTREDVVATRTDDYVLLVGKPWEAKGADVLLRAFLKITDQHPSVKLILAGSDEDWSWIRAMIPVGARVELIARLPHDEVLSLIAGCRVFALPSWTEGTPRTIIEAFASARPVISTRTDGIPYIVRPGETGELVPTGDVDALASALHKLLADRAYAESLGMNGQHFARTEFNAARVASMWADAANAVLGRPLRVAAEQVPQPSPLAVPRL
jgi:glycosyltransferase involved in cell wall biosynthesis